MPAKPLTRAQKLAKALKACKKQKSKSKRKVCEAQAKKRYKPKPKKKVKALAMFAEANHTGWPETTNHEGHPNNESGTMRGKDGIHNMLLGGDGNDTIWAGNDGDVIWGDSHPGGQPESQVDHLHGGAGVDWLYASHGTNYIWTGAGDDHVALVYGRGVVHCDGPGHKTLVMRYLPENRHYQLIGCNDITIEPYRA